MLKAHRSTQRYQRLGLKRRRRKRLSRARRAVVAVPSRPNERWSMDFVSDCLVSGRRVRTLNVVDDYTREALAIVVDVSIPGLRVSRVLDELNERHGRPERIVVDSGPEFSGRPLDAWAYERGVLLHFITPGRPVENCYIESFNGRLRVECLNEHWFADLADARSIIESWRNDYSWQRPHSSLGQLSPSEFALPHRQALRPQTPTQLC